MYQAGWSRQEISVAPRGYAMHGYGQWHHRARGTQTPLFARALFVRDENGRALDFCCLDLGYVTHAMRAGICERLGTSIGADFDASALVLTCTHTHSGPGGCTHDVLYNVVTPGFVPAHLEAVIAAAVAAIIEARRTAAPTMLGFAQGSFDEQVPVAWNRSLRAYNRNPDVVPRAETETQLALNRRMQVLSLRRDGVTQALVSWFGVHATCLGSGLDRYDGDNKGYAAAQAEERLRQLGAARPVAIFAQGTAGDVSPHFHGPGDMARRRRLKGEAEYAYAETNGRHQSACALSLLEGNRDTPIRGGIDTIFSYADFTAIKVDPNFADGNTDAMTSEPCHGVAFFAGTPIDGIGSPAVLIAAVKRLAQAVRNYRLSSFTKASQERRAQYQRLYASQGAKLIFLEAGSKRILGQPLDRLPLPGFLDPSVGELKRQVRSGAVRHSALVPTVLPLQIVTIGPLALLCCPGEFTTIAGARLLQVVQALLRVRGVRDALICTYCNDYMGYVTTREEYQEQAYEGGHTVYGQWTLAAFQTRYAQLAGEMLKPETERAHDRSTRPRLPPAEELAVRSDLPVPR